MTPSSELELSQEDILLQKATEMMASERFQQHADNSFDRRNLIKMTNSLGGPRMRLVHSKVIERLGRIPRSSEGYAQDAYRLVESLYNCSEIFFFSHQWLRPNYQDPTKSHPDTEDHIKAKAINEFVKWRKQYVQHNHSYSPQILFWIDFCCHDQDNLELGFSLLPIWTACCERFLRFETPSYHTRVWCRLEPLLSAKFSFADHQTVIGPNYRNRWPDTGKRSSSILLDPREAEGALTDPKDAGKLKPLLALAVDPSAGRLPIVLGKTSIKTFELSHDMIPGCSCVCL